MKAAVLYANEDIRFDDYKEPVIDSDSIIIKVKVAGICGSDVPRVLYNGAHYYPNVLGHEFSGDSKYTDILCSLGKGKNIPVRYRKRQFRVISFTGNNGKTVTLCSNIYSLTADEIADLYRMRWNIETFFRTLKQNFALKKLFGSTAL